MSATPKVWLVTGSSRGLGRSIVEAALSAGDHVVATARNPEPLHDLQDRYSNDRLLVATHDVAVAESAGRVVSAALDAFGRLDVLVNNAGYADIAAVEDVALEDFSAQIATNFFGVVYLTKAVIPVMREQGSGHIFQVSSIGGRIGSPGLAAYQSAKWAVGGFSTVLAQEVAPLGIRVTVIEPGAMRTDWAGSSMATPPVTEPYVATVGAFANMIRESSGTQPIDPLRVAQVMVDLTEVADPPLRLLMGTGLIEFAASAAKVLADSDQAWRYLSDSVHFDDEHKREA